MIVQVVFVVIAVISQGLCQEKCSDPKQFLCHSGGCISKVFLCDGSRECFDGSDETHDLCQYRGCSESIDYETRDKEDIFAIPSLGTGQTFRCGYGACISHQFVCDGIRHCVADGSDETAELCRNVRCDRKEFKCAYGGCVERRNTCDNRFNCFDGSDETKEACRWRRRRCLDSKHFQCDYGSCIASVEKCDGVSDCLDGSDESEKNCGPGHKLKVSAQDTTSTTTTPPAPTIVPVVRFPTVNEPITFAGPVSSRITTAKPASTVRASSKGCQQTVDVNIGLEILACGDNSECEGALFPAESLVIFHCPSESVPLQCKEDNLWHFARDPSRTSRITPCHEQSLNGNTVETVVEPRNIYTLPKACGRLGPNEPLPWLVGLFRGQEFSCSGTLIGPALVLTAGHCIVRNQASNNEKIDPSELKIQFSSPNPNDPKTFASVSSIELYPMYTGGTTPRYDVALLFLSDNLEKTYGTSSACLDEDGKLLSVSGWTFDRTMGELAYRWGVVEKVLDPSCFNRASKCSRHLDIGDNQFCGANKEVSSKRLHQGSSGGPYIIVDSKGYWATAGIVSHSFDTSECGTNSVFTSVSKLRPWIVNCGFHGKCGA